MRSPRGSRNSRSGFTILEVVVVVSLIALISTLGYLFSFQYVRAQHLREDAQLIQFELQLARAEASAQKDASAHGVKVFTNRLVRFSGGSYATRTTSKDATTTFPITATVGGDDEIVFPAGGIVPDAASSVTVTSAPTTLTISVSTYGLVEIN